MRHTLELLRLLLLSLIPVVIAIACAGGAWISRRALRPVDEITAAARTIGIENLSQRLPVARRPETNCSASPRSGTPCSGAWKRR